MGIKRGLRLNDDLWLSRMCSTVISPSQSKKKRIERKCDPRCRNSLALLVLVGSPARKTKMSHDSRSRGVISFPLDCLLFFSFGQSITRTTFQRAVFNHRLHKRASLFMCVSLASALPSSPARLRAPWHVDKLGPSQCCGWPGRPGRRGVRFTEWEVDNKVQWTKMPPSQPLASVNIRQRARLEDRNGGNGRGDSQLSRKPLWFTGPG